MLSLPNLISIFRLTLSPVFIGLFLVDRWWGAVAALAVAVLFEATDLLDGFIARRYDLVSPLGKLIDPLADSVSRFSVFLAFTTEATVRDHPWPVLLAAAIFYRDAIVAYVRIFAASTGVVLAARLSGKLKAIFQGVGIIIFLSLRCYSFRNRAFRPHLPVVFYAVMVPIVAVTVWSGVDYLWANRGAIVAMSRPDADRDE